MANVITPQDLEPFQIPTKLRSPSDLPQVRLSLATIYQGTGRSELSEDQVRRVIEEQPSNSDAHRMLGQTLAVQGRLDEALEEHQQAIDLRPNYWRHHGDLGLLYF